MTRVVLDLASNDEKATLQLLKRLLKLLGRVYGIRCRSVTMGNSDGKTTGR